MSRSNGNLRKRIRRFILLHKYLLPYWDKQLLIFFCSVGFIAFGIITPYMSRMVIDYGLLRGDIVVFNTILLCSVILFLFSALIGIIQKYISFHIVLKIGYQIRMDFFKILCRKPLNFFEGTTTGELLYRINADSSGVIGLITGTIPNILLTTLKLVFITSICLWLNWKATAVVFAGMPFFYLLNHYFGKKSFGLNKEINEKGQQISQQLQDNLSQIKLYKAFKRERRGLNTYKFKSIEQMRVLVRNFWLGIANEQSSQVLNTGFGLLLTFYLGTMVIGGTMTLGSFVALSIYLVQLAGILKSLGGIYQGIVSQFIYVDRFFEIYEDAKSIPFPDPPVEIAKPARKMPALEIKNLCFGYGPDKEVLKHLNFSLDPGETAAIVGNSGIGKSTLAELIAGLYKPHAGGIFIGGRNISQMTDAAIRNNIGIVLQDAVLLNQTIRDNMTFGRTNVSDDTFFQVARIAEVDDFVRQHPSGYEMPSGEQGAGLSQGQQQRIAIAMALMKRPDILIFDEATNQLEQEIEERIIRNIRTHFPLTALILISCRLNTLKLADRIYELKEGALSETHPNWVDPNDGRKLKLVFNSIRSGG